MKNALPTRFLAGTTGRPICDHIRESNDLGLLSPMTKYSPSRSANGCPWVAKPGRWEFGKESFR